MRRVRRIFTWEHTYFSGCPSAPKRVFQSARSAYSHTTTMQSLTISSQDIMLYVSKTKPNHFFTDVPGCDMPFFGNLKYCSIFVRVTDCGVEMSLGGVRFVDGVQMFFHM